MHRNLTFMGPCIVNVFLSITNKMKRCTILFIIVNALHVSSGFSAHHQGLKSVHAASGICQTCLLLPLAWMSWDWVPTVHAASGIYQTCLLLPLAWMSWDWETCKLIRPGNFNNILGNETKSLYIIQGAGVTTGTHDWGSNLATS